MPSFEDLTRTSVRILADTVEKSRDAEHPSVRSVTRILRAFERGEPEGDLFEASDRFNRFDRKLRSEIAESSVREAEDHVRRRRAGRSGGDGGRRSEGKPGLLGVLNRT